MMGWFEFNKQINRDKIFLIQHSELEARIDPHQYHHERIASIKAIKRKNKTVHLSQLVTSVKSIAKEISSEDTYIGLENITSNTGEYVATSEKQSISTAGVFKKGEILFPKLRPYLNKVYLAEFDGICSTEFHIFQAKNISPEFLTIYLRSDLIVNQTKHLMTGNTLPRLQTEDIQKLPVPLVSTVIQSKVIEVYKKADKQKQQKEQQAQALLDSIDTYLLNELGITLPQRDGSLEKRVFTTLFSKATGYRIDPDYYKLSYQEFIEQIKKSKFSLVALGEATSLLASGKTPASFEYSEEPTDYPIIKVGSYTKHFIDLKKTDFAIARQRLIAQKGDIFILSAAHQPEYVGRHIKYLNDEPQVNTSYVGELICVRTNELCNSMYLFSLLMLDMFKVLINREKTGQTSHVYGKDIQSIQIPLPSISKQNEIATHITQIRTQAKQLQIEAAQVLNNAKAEIEQMILGNTA
jgi:restriction endonuclease S subunit